jgi:hypothetical protein
MARGPAYPFVDLEQAVGFISKMYQFTRRSPVQAGSVIQEAWRYSPTSSGSQKTLAALKYFGLVEDVEGGDGRLIKVSDRAYRILVDEVTSPERRQALQEAALSPKAYLLCWTRWGTEMPPSMRSTLIFDEGFIESTVDGFIADYKKSMEYAGLLGGPIEAEEDIPEPESTQPAARPTSTPTAPQAISSPPHNDSVNSAYRSDVFSLTEGTVSLTWPKQLSADSFQDLSDWLDLLKRKIERTVSSGSKESSQG